MTEFQSPSLRGSGRFLGEIVSLADAYVVSIPFIAGQWSLPRYWVYPISRRSCFNPLHCGAVVASLGAIAFLAINFLVSIPFIAGQWSLPFSFFF